MKPTVYIETTIAGHLTSRIPKNEVVAGQMIQTREWWAASRQLYDCFTSLTVLDEAGAGDAVAAKERLEALAQLPLVPVSPAAMDLAELLLQHSALPRKAQVDAAHVAIADTNGMRFLLTWNCRHLANANLRAKIVQTCSDFGYNVPVICTPAELKEAET